MAENDISKIVNLIMQNPKLIEEIKSIAENESGNADAEQTAPVAEEPTASIPTEAPVSDEKSRRRALLSAIKPYVSKERCAAIDSMMTVSDILDMMKAR